MNYHQASNLLDEVREGANHSVYMINKALELTGDLLESGAIERLGGGRVGKTVQEQGKRPGSVRCPSMVAKDVIRHSADSWAISG